MTDDDVRRHLESLLREFGEVSKLQVRHDERITEGTEDRREMRRSMEKLEARSMQKMEKLEIELLAAIGRSEKRTRDLVTDVKESCDKGWSEFQTWVNKYEDDKKTDRQHGLARWMLVVGVVSAIIAAIACIVGLLAFLTGAAA
jgi:hypothetical protein